MKTKVNKESRSLLVAMLLGDGTISNNYVFKLSHGSKQLDYLRWKLQLLKDHGIKNSGIKEYISTKGYNVGDKVCYLQLSINPFIKLLRRIFYKEKKIIGNRKILNRLNRLGLAIWYMDDGHINIRKTKNKIHGFYIRISLCEPKEEVQTVIDYFKEVWNVNFYMFHEGRKDDSYSLCCGTQEGIKFINLIKEYVDQVPSMKYKIQYDLSQRVQRLQSRRSNSLSREKSRNTRHSEKNEDIV